MKRRCISVMWHWLCLNCLPTWLKRPWRHKPGQIYINSSQCHPYYVYSEEKKSGGGGVYDLGINRRAETNWYQFISLSFSGRGVWGFGCLISPPKKRGTRLFSWEMRHHRIPVLCLFYHVFPQSWLSGTSEFLPSQKPAQLSPASYSLGLLIHKYCSSYSFTESNVLVSYFCPGWHCFSLFMAQANVFRR